MEQIIAYAPTTVVVTLTPSSPSLAGYFEGYVGGAKQLAGRLSSLSSVKNVIYVSSTRVYAETEGGWVTEASALALEDEFCRCLIEAEKVISALPMQTSILRAAGLYSGPSRYYLSRLQRGMKSPCEPPVYTNRIHRDDVAGFIVHLLEHDLECSPIFNLSDGHPIAKYDFEALVARYYGLDFETLLVDDAMATQTHKRISNELMLATGFKLKYPNVEKIYAI